MLTFQEALTLLKQGRDVRREAWPRLSFVRATPVRTLTRITVVPTTLQTTTAPYTLTDPDLFATDWSIA